MKAIYIDRRGAHDAVAETAHRQVRDVMSTPVTCVGLPTTLEWALETMACNGLRHLAVVDDAGRFQGMVSDRAIAAAWAADFSCLPRLPVAAILDPVGVSVAGGAQVVDVARLMRTAGTDAVAVLDPDAVVIGIVTGSDLIALLAGVVRPPAATPASSAA